MARNHLWGQARLFSLPWCLCVHGRVCLCLLDPMSTLTAAKRRSRVALAVFGAEHHGAVGGHEQILDFNAIHNM